MNQNYHLDGEGYPLIHLASLFSQQSEALRQIERQLQANTVDLTTGTEGWRGTAAKAYVRTSEFLYDRMDKLMLVYEQTSTALYQLGDRLIGLRALRFRIQQLHQQMMEIAYEHRGQVLEMGSNYAMLSQEYDRLVQEELMYDQKYSNDATQFFQEIRQMLPAIGQLMEDLKKQAILSGLFSGQLPQLVGLDDAAGKTGRDKIDALNDVIMTNQLVIEFYQEHPEATGPDGATASEMVQRANDLIHQARQQGGTYGVPIIFMHGLEGDEGTFQKMTEYFGGFTVQYFWSNNQIDTRNGENDSAENPIIQFVFRKGAMPFSEQSEAFQQMLDQVKKKYGVDQVMVVSHSMGGVITTKYIEDTGGEDITKFVTLGSPITGSKVDEIAQDGLQETPLAPIVDGVDALFPAVDQLQSGSMQNEEIYDNRSKFNPHTQVFSGAGTDLGILGDGVVTPDSAMALKDFAGDGEFSSKIYTDATHPDLHDQLPEIEDTISFLLYGEKPHGEQ